jgi:hypothetical protein
MEYEPGRSAGPILKNPVSKTLSNRIREIDEEASKQKRSRNEYLELCFELLFFVIMDHNSETMDELVQCTQC